MTRKRITHYITALVIWRVLGPLQATPCESEARQEYTIFFRPVWDLRHGLFQHFFYERIQGELVVLFEF